MRCVWIKNVYNTGPNFYLSEVWLEQAARKRKGLYVRHPVCEAGEWNGDFYKIRPQPDEAIVIKHRFGAFESTDLDLVLRSQGIRSVVMTGIATNVCVETTARQAFMRDYYVVFTSDCTATYSQRAHDATLREHRPFLRTGGDLGRDHGVLAAGRRQAARGDLRECSSNSGQRPHLARKQVVDGELPVCHALGVAIAAECLDRGAARLDAEGERIGAAPATISSASAVPSAAGCARRCNRAAGSSSGCCLVERL